jgi:hypothetical protein
MMAVGRPHARRTDTVSPSPDIAESPGLNGTRFFHAQSFFPEVPRGTYRHPGLTIFEPGTLRGALGIGSQVQPNGN